VAKTITIEPFTRVEGDLRIKVEIKDNIITDARASGIMFRGFEKILRGHYPEDALVFTPRICGICSISHSVAASSALAAVSEEFVPSSRGQIAKSIVHATETVMSHLTQFYIYFIPDLLNRRFENLKGYDSMLERFTPMKGTSVRRILEERKRFLEILGIIVGKWPHTLAIHPGGITKSLNASEIFRVRGVLRQFISVVEELLLGMSTEEYLQISSVKDFESLFLAENGNLSDLGLFFSFAREAGLMQMGKGSDRFISAEAYLQPDGTSFISSGYWDGEVSELEVEKITESIKFSFFNFREESISPFEDLSEPNRDKPDAYSWAKAPRYDGKVVEVGALARQVINGDPLLREFFHICGSTVFTRVFARLHEAVKLLNAMDSWIRYLDTSESYYSKNLLKSSAKGVGITEAARGILSHWIVIEEGLIKNYQVITPTAWNCSPRDEKGTPGALEQALLGTPIKDENNPVEIGIIVRSYDPCLVCTVH
jgi:hydrogenase large subunit